MKHVRSPILMPLRIVAVSAALLFSQAHADEYADVSQLVRAGKLQDALTKADVYLAAKPKDPQMRFLKGVIQRDSGKTPEAITTFTKLTEDFPELPEPYNNLAVLYAGQSQFDKARTALEMAIRTNPSYATAHENLGDVYAKLASQAYNKALQLDTGNTAVPPKLALIRELFSATGAKGVRPSPVTPVAPTTPAATPTPVPAVAPTHAASTPISTPAPASPAVAGNATKDAEAAVRAWASAWSSKDVKGYLASYGKEFNPPGSMSRSAWEEERKQRIVGKSKISVGLENLNVVVNGNKATAKFRQDYKAGELAVSSRKTLELVKSSDRWHIVKESTGN
jgi:Flp pilus assembly protein TadD/ketosteroid isomerase-like protein